MKYKVGDRVRAIYGAPKGHIGEIMSISDSETITVKFDDWHEGHPWLDYGNTIDCGKSGWWMDEKDIELVEREGIINGDTYKPGIVDDISDEVIDTIISNLSHMVRSTTRPLLTNFGQELPNKPKNKTMSIIKNLAKSEKTKAFEYFTLIDGCGDYTQNFINEWSVASYEGMTAQEFDKKIIEAWKLETKKK